MPSQTQAVREEMIMTDKQFEAIIEMVLQILNRSKDIDDARQALLAIKGGKHEEPESRN
jgi:hypothetical protein